MLLMNGDIAVLEFSLLDMYLRVIDNKYLPFELKDFIETTNPSNYTKSVRDFEVFRDFLASRVILLSREHAKTILNVTQLPQSLKTEDRIKIVLACNGLSMIDNFWIKKDNNDTRKFSDVNLRKHRLSEVAYDIAILGKYISASSNDLIPELTTLGMSPKCWRRESDGIKLYKTDKLKGTVNTKAELEASKLLRASKLDVIECNEVLKDDNILSVSKCIATDELSLIHASSLRDWCVHTGRDFKKYIHNYYLKEFSNMVVIDYVIANTDRHFENWGFLVNRNNDIEQFAPLFDFDMALIADNAGTDISDLIYEPTGLTFIESLDKYAKTSNVKFNRCYDYTQKVKSRIGDYNKRKDPLNYYIDVMGNT